jgi:two-component system sensor histidine kinase CpxA
MLVAGHPRLYWTGVYLGEVRRGPASSLTLVLASPSLSGGGLFFDYKPWLALGGSLVLLSILWWLPFVRGLTGSLARMTDVAEEIARGQFRTARPSHRRDELGRLGRALDHMSARLEGYVTGQKRFLGDTAHELLSPLARLEVALSILEQRSGSPDDRRYVERSLEEVRQMSGLVNDLLAYTKAGLRAQTAELRPVAVAEVARLAVARELAEEKVTVDVPEDCRVQADPELLLRALSNGVRNALCYAAQGGPIAITASPAEAPPNGCIDVSVVDQGPGVAPEYIDRLFDPFFRPEDARTRETGGTGLGLAIVKTCIEACGGTALVRNRVPHGLLLTFRLPGATCEAHDARGGDSAVLATREIER